jgi:hypothetical protein
MEVVMTLCLPTWYTESKNISLISRLSPSVHLYTLSIRGTEDLQIQIEEAA